MRSINFSPTIDGLRAVAVVTVVFYHLRSPLVGGGFVGVDVFFVISGYLISGKILNDMDIGQFSLKRFFWGRVRRIFPALVVTTMATFFVAALLLSPRLIAETAIAGVSAIFFVSNILFYSQAGYFDTDAYLKPLLHTWSLGVEGQFYLIWPFALLLWARIGSKIHQGIIAVLIFAIMAFLAEWASRWHPEAAFYLMPFRIAEFMIGAVLAASQFQIRSGPIASIATIAGLGMIIAAVGMYDSAMIFPGFSAMLPAIGAGVVILGGENVISRVILANRVSQYVGVTSYSIYLVHWPLVVFYSVVTSSVSWSMGEVSVLVLIVMILSTALYYCVEEPFRRGAWVWQRPSDSSIIRLSAVSAALVTFAGCALALVIGTSTHPSSITRDFDVGDERRASNQMVSVPDGPSVQPFEGEGLRVLILGDSHSKDMFNALYLVDEGNVRQYRRLELRPVCFGMLVGSILRGPVTAVEDECFEQFRAIDNSSLKDSADVVIYSAFWPEASIPFMRAGFEYLRGLSPSLFVTTKRVGFPDVPELLTNSASLERAIDVANSNRDERFNRVNDELRSAIAVTEAVLLDLLAVTCPDGACPIVSDDGKILYYDGHHWTLDGARYFGQRMVERGVVALLRTVEAR